MEVKLIFDLLDYVEQNYKKDDTFAVKRNGNWEKFNYKQYREYVDNFSMGLLALGFKKGDKIVTVSNNRPEWNFADMAMMQVGVVHVPVYPTISIDDYKHILSHSEARILIVSDTKLYVKLLQVVKVVPNIEHIYTFNNCEGTSGWEEICELGKANRSKYFSQLQERKKSVQPNDLASIIYTSGTTGFPKGVMLSHDNFLSNVLMGVVYFQYNKFDKALSFLPLCHVFEHTASYLYQYLGISIYYAESTETIVADLNYVKPDCFVTVPRVLEKVYDKIMLKGKEMSGIKKLIFLWSVGLGLKYELNRQNGWWYEFQLKIANKLVFSKWREALGGNVKMIVCGGAALQPRLARIFWAARILISEGYGLTETSPIVTANHCEYPKIGFGTVGVVAEGVAVKIAEDGEVLVKGPNVMLGYYRNPELTAQVIDSEGWFHTGDIGEFDELNRLKITDRKKEMFKLSGGKYVAPQVVENVFKESFFIEQLVVVGENEKFAAAIISPNFYNLHRWASLHKLHYRDNLDLIKKEEVVARFQKEIDKLNLRLGHTERIKKFALVGEEWTPDSGELSPTLKLKRKFIVQKYRALIDKIYENKLG